MRSSIGVTKVLAFYFILLHLFLKAKMCVGTVHGASSGNINDSDESFFPVEPHTTVAPLLDSMPSPVGRTVAKIHRRQHAATVSTTPKPTAAPHHVRHEHSHVKNRHIVQPHKSDFKSAEGGRNWYPNHRRPPHHHRGSHQRDLHPTSSTSFALSSHKTKLNRSNSRSVNNIDDQYKPSLNPWISSQRKTSLVFTTEKIPSNMKKHPSTVNSKTTRHHTKNYFEELLKNYKSQSPYYKDHLQKETSMLTKSLQSLNTKCNDKKCKSRHTKDETNDDDYYYDYEEDEEDEDDYDDEYYDTEAQGDAGYSTTANTVVSVTESTNHIQEQDYSAVNNKFDNSLQQDNEDAINIKDLQTSISNHVDTMRENKKVKSKEIHATDSIMAKSHVAKLRREGNCFVPKPKIVLASNDPTKQYTPHCTILHRCGDDVGCCPSAQTCAASKNSTVELYFFVKAVGSRSTIERLSFINHTECACINRQKSTNRRTPIVPVADTPSNTAICNCPSYFQRVVDNDNRCFCDCSSSDPQCDQFKRGLEHFSMDNRRCILNKRCEEPRCEFGKYDPAKGKCPAKKDALSITLKGF